MTWTSGDEIVVCMGKLVNTGDTESADAVQIKQRVNKERRDLFSEHAS